MSVTQTPDKSHQAQAWECLLHKIFGLYPMAGSMVAPDLLKELEDLKALIKTQVHKFADTPDMQVPLAALFTRVDKEITQLPSRARTVRSGSDEMKSSLAAPDKIKFINFLFEIAAPVIVEYQKTKL